MNRAEISINHAVIIGRLSRGPVLRHLRSGTVMCQLRVVTTESYVNRDGMHGEGNQSHTVVIWGKRGEDMSTRLLRDDVVYVGGRLHTRSFKNLQGETEWVTEINARTVYKIPLVPTVEHENPQMAEDTQKGV